jgi:uncharacterized protein YidB (DUF937 family)
LAKKPGEGGWPDREAAAAEPWDIPPSQEERIMGLLESVLGALGAKGAPGAPRETPAEGESLQEHPQEGGIGMKLIGLVGEVIQAHGGLQGLMQQFESKGLGHLFASWVGSQPNLEISPEQVQHAVGPEQLAGLAQKFGIDPAKASQMMAQFLPKIVDQLTPKGEIEPDREIKL